MLVVDYMAKYALMSSLVPNSLAGVHFNRSAFRSQRDKCLGISTFLQQQYTIDHIYFAKILKNASVYCEQKVKTSEFTSSN